VPEKESIPTRKMLVVQFPTHGLTGKDNAGCVTELHKRHDVTVVCCTIEQLLCYELKRHRRVRSHLSVGVQIDIMRRHLSAVVDD
jgi:hypothetical protein